MTLAQLSQNHANALSAEQALRSRIRKDQRSHRELISKRKTAKRLLDAAEEAYHYEEPIRVAEEFAADGFQRMKEAIKKWAIYKLRFIFK